MRIVFITPGTGNYFCGVCMRDNAIIANLRTQGHDAVILPMYLPTLTDEPSMSEGMPIFFGGINVYLQQKAAIFRHTPGWFDRMMDSPFALRLASRSSGMTEGAALGALTLSMLRGESGNQFKEVEKLVAWLRAEPPPDLVFLSTVLQTGLAQRLQEVFDAPVYCFLQGEDGFIDSLGEDHRRQAWQILRSRAEDIDGFIAPSRFFSGVMREKLDISADRVRVIPNGICLDGYDPRTVPPDPPVIGFLARLTEAKGLGVLVDAFITLRERAKESIAPCRLAIAGSSTGADAAFIRDQKRKLEGAGLLGEVSLHENLDRAEKLAFLRGLTLFSVPATYGEAFGLYLIEAMATGVPVVQPSRGSFPEILAATGGGMIYEPDTKEALCSAWEELLLDPSRMNALGAAGRKSVFEKFGVDRMSTTLLEICESW